MGVNYGNLEDIWLLRFYKNPADIVPRLEHTSQLSQPHVYSRPQPIPSMRITMNQNQESKPRIKIKIDERITTLTKGWIILGLPC